MDQLKNGRGEVGLPDDEEPVAQHSDPLYKFINFLPPDLRNRIIALKNNQVEYLMLEAAFYRDVLKLQQEYFASVKPFLTSRSEILNGIVEAPPETPTWKSSDVPGEGNVEAVELTAFKKEFNELSNTTKGIPNFWLTIFKNHNSLSQLVKGFDEPILKKLRNIEIHFDIFRHSFTVEFDFEENDYFRETKLTKTYFFKLNVDINDPFSFTGHEMYQCVGCPINWYEGKNVAVCMGLHQDGPVDNTATGSFFNYFSPPHVPLNIDDDAVNKEIRGILEEDFAIGLIFKNDIVPRAILYFTGELGDSDNEYEEEAEESSDEEKDAPVHSKNNEAAVNADAASGEPTD